MFTIFQRTIEETIYIYITVTYLIFIDAADMKGLLFAVDNVAQTKQEKQTSFKRSEIA